MLYGVSRIHIVWVELDVALTAVIARSLALSLPFLTELKDFERRVHRRDSAHARTIKTNLKGQ